MAASSIDTAEVELKEAEQEALADQALAEFAAAYGLEMPAAPQPEKAKVEAEEASSAVKDMGPEATETEG